jgi:protein O-mannosyl-transferase
VPWAAAWLIAAFVLPNLWTLTGSFLYDDLPIIVQNARLHSLNHLAEIWTHGYWPDRPGLTLYRPITQTIWAALWTLGGGKPLIFHALNLVLGGIVVWQVYLLLVRLRVGFRTSFFAALLFAVLPIHTEVTAAIVGSNELLAAALGLGALLCYLRGSFVVALPLYLLAVFSKESAAAFAGLALLFPFLGTGQKPDFRRVALTVVVTGAVVALALFARNAVKEGPVFIPPIDNPMSLTPPFARLVTALWIQVLYVAKSLVPVTLSADYSYKEIPLVMNLENYRAWLGLGAALLVVVWYWRRPASRLGLAFWIVLFSPAANLVMPIGTMMGERLAFLPSIGLVLLAAQGLRRLPRAEVVVAIVAVIFAGRTFVRDRDWHDADAFYPKLAQTSPGSAKAHYFLGCWLDARGNPGKAVEAYERAVKIFPAYPEAFNNRGCALVELGRIPEAKESFRQCIRFDPGHSGAASSLQSLEAGIIFVPQKPRI